jgi:hypothetical protein
MGKSEVYLTSFDVSPVEYFDLMLDTVVQQEIHTSKDGRTRKRSGKTIQNE